jgi:hypothetical protein
MSLIWPAPLVRDPDIYVTDFAEYAVGAQPSDWTSRYVTGGFTAIVQSVAGSLSGKALRWTKTAANRQTLSWDKIPLVADVEILIRARKIEAGVSADNIVGIWLRGSGAAGAENGYRALASTLSTNQRWVHQLTRYVAGANTVVGSAFSPLPVGANLTTNAWFWLRFRANGSTFSRKGWLDGQTEPGTFDLTDTGETGVLTPGWVGLHNSAADPDVEIDFYSVALRGKTAPSMKK